MEIIKKAGAAISKFFRKKNKHLGRNRFLPVELQAEIIAESTQRRMNRDDKRRAVYHQQQRLGLFKK